MWVFIWYGTRRQKEDALNFRVKKENEVSAAEKVKVNLWDFKRSENKQKSLLEHRIVYW